MNTQIDLDEYELYERARALIGIGQGSRAIPLLNRCLELDPEYSYALCSLAMIHSNSGDEVAALKYADRAIECDPEEEWCHRLRSSILSGLHRFEDSLAAAREAARLDPENLLCLERLVYAELNNSLLEDAERTAAQLIALHPDASEGHECLASVYLYQRKYAAAAAELAVCESRDREICLEMLCWLHCQAAKQDRNHHDRAELAAQRLVDLHPAHYFSYHVIGDVMAARRDWPAAERWYREGLPTFREAG